MNLPNKIACVFGYVVAVALIIGGFAGSYNSVWKKTILPNTGATTENSHFCWSTKMF